MVVILVAELSPFCTVSPASSETAGLPGSLCSQSLLHPLRTALQPGQQGGQGPFTEREVGVLYHSQRSVLEIQYDFIATSAALTSICGFILKG